MPFSTGCWPNYPFTKLIHLQPIESTAGLTRQRVFAIVFPVWILLGIQPRERRYTPVRPFYRRTGSIVVNDTASGDRHADHQH